MLTCGECKHFEWARGLTGRKLLKIPGRCNGKQSGSAPTAWLYYDRPGIAPKQVRSPYYDSQMAGQCAAFEQKDCAPSGKGVYTELTRTANQEANA